MASDERQIRTVIRRRHPQVWPEDAGLGQRVKRAASRLPDEARHNRIQGSGVFILNISHQTGRVDSITIKKSTRHRILDAAAMKAFFTYRFKPGTPPKVWIPVDFTYGQ